MNLIFIELLLRALPSYLHFFVLYYKTYTQNERNGLDAAGRRLV